MKLTECSIKSGLKCNIIGKKILCLDKVDSTNEFAWKEALNGAPDGTVIFAEEQTKGRGRLGRQWFSPKSASILCSIILRPEISLRDSMLLTAIGALATVDAIEKATGLKALIQFPNDVVLDGKKVAGILVESRFISSKPDILILGIGINVNIPANTFPKGIRNTATSLLAEERTEINRLLLARHLLESLDTWYEILCKGEFTQINHKWRQYSYILHKRVKLYQNGKVFSGIVDEIDPIEGIVLRMDTGHIKRFQGEHIEKLTLA